MPGTEAGHVAAAGAVGEVVVVKEGPLVGVQYHGTVRLDPAVLFINPHRNGGVCDVQGQGLLHGQDARLPLAALRLDFRACRRVRKQPRLPGVRIRALPVREVRGHRVSCLVPVHQGGRLPKPEVRHLPAVSCLPVRRQNGRRQRQTERQDQHPFSHNILSSGARPRTRPRAQAFCWEL